LDKKNILRSDFILLTTALIWGLAFVAQKKGMEFTGPFTFNAIRFALGALVVLIFIPLFRNKNQDRNRSSVRKLSLWSWGIIAGLALFLGSSLQQTGIVYTSAGNAGFITSLYVILTPVLGLVIKQKTNLQTWMGVLFATTGLYFLSVTNEFRISGGDLLVFGSAFFFAVHVLIIGYLSPLYNNYKLAFIQFTVTAVLSFIVSVFYENYEFEAIIHAGIPILYAGILSTAVAFTLQIVGQRKTIPSHAAILLSFESVFALVGGWLLLNEDSTFRQITGCALMFTGIIISQIRVKNKK